MDIHIFVSVKYVREVHKIVVVGGKHMKFHNCIKIINLSRTGCLLMKDVEV